MMEILINECGDRKVVAVERWGRVWGRGRYMMMVDDRWTKCKKEQGYVNGNKDIVQSARVGDVGSAVASFYGSVA
jgi:hypothetical protein